MNRTIIITIFLLASLVLGIGFLWPKYQDLRVLQVDIEGKRKELQSREQYLSQLNQLSQELKKYEAPLSKIDSALPSDISLPSLFYFLQKASSQTGLVLEGVGQVSTEALGENLDVKGHSISLSVSGSYSAFKNFLSVLEKNARLIEVESIGFSSPPAASPFSFGIRIKAHSY